MCSLRVTTKSGITEMLLGRNIGTMNTSPSSRAPRKGILAIAKPAGRASAIWRISTPNVKMNELRIVRRLRKSNAWEKLSQWTLGGNRWGGDAIASVGDINDWETR